jgi:T5orf172 domain
MRGYVYLLEEQDFSGNATGLYKIGKTTQNSIEARTKQYKAGNARPVIEYHSVGVSNCQAIETTLHREYKHLRLNAGGGDEWFQLSGSNLSAVVRSMDSYASGRQRVNRPALSASAPSRSYRQSPTSSGIPSLFWWLAAGLGVLFFAAAKPGNADITIGQSYRLNQDPFIGCPAAKQPCNGSNVWSDDYRIIGTRRNGTIVKATARNRDPKYTEVTFSDGSKGWVYTASLKPQF